jgi:hypothetical protein
MAKKKQQPQSTITTKRNAVSTKRTVNRRPAKSKQIAAHPRGKRPKVRPAGVSYQFQTIHTLEARSNALLEVTQEHFKLTDPQVFQMIQGLLKPTIDILAGKGVVYDELRSVLVPSRDRHDRAVVFNYNKFDTGDYGSDVVHRLMPMLRQDSSHSLLFGDWLNGERKDMAFGKWLEWSPGALGTVSLDLAHERYSPYYFAYLNNLTTADAARIDQGFKAHPAYLGSLDLDFDSAVKTYLSTCLIRDFIKHRRVIIKGHEDDRDPAEDYNLSRFDFDQFGLTVRSLPFMYYGVLLSYKIEREHVPQDGDRRFSLNALTPAPKMIDDFEVQLDQAKWKYLQEEKGGSLKLAGMAGLDAVGIAKRIREKVDDSYIYRLARATNGETLKFNVMIEPTPRVRIECALEYLPERGLLRVITLY